MQNTQLKNPIPRAKVATYLANRSDKKTRPGGHGRISFTVTVEVLSTSGTKGQATREHAPSWVQQHGQSSDRQGGFTYSHWEVAKASKLGLFVKSLRCAVVGRVVKE